MSNRFKIGEKVKCLETSGCGGFIKDKCYIVTASYNNWLNAIDSDGNLNGWGSEHFIKALKLKRKTK
jgi:hypothetical protein